VFASGKDGQTLPSPWNVLRLLPIFINSAPENVAVTLTLQANGEVDPNNPVPINVYDPNAPDTYPGTTIVSLYPNQTTTVTFDVPKNGGWIFNPGLAVGAVENTPANVMYEVEDMVWG
jgi:hypothetical protein